MNPIIEARRLTVNREPVRAPVRTTGNAPGAAAALSTDRRCYRASQPGDTIDGVDRLGHFASRRAKREVERALMASGMQYTILRPTLFMEIWAQSNPGFRCGRAERPHLQHG